MAYTANSPAREYPVIPHHARLFFCSGHDLLHQQPQVVICPAGKGFSVLGSRRAVPRSHVVVPVQITDGYQTERRTASSLAYFKYLLAFVGDSVVVTHMGIRLAVIEGRYHFPTDWKYVHIMHTYRFS